MLALLSSPGKPVCSKLSKALKELYSIEKDKNFFLLFFLADKQAVFNPQNKIVPTRHALLLTLRTLGLVGSSVVVNTVMSGFLKALLPELVWLPERLLSIIWTFELGVLVTELGLRQATDEGGIQGDRLFLNFKNKKR